MFSRLSNTIQFPFYIVPSIPFWRRTSTTGFEATPQSVHRPGTPKFEPYLAGCLSYLRCAKCAVDVCLTSQIISKGFTGRHGRAYLVAPCPSSPATLPNTTTDSPSQRQLVTGVHTVSDVRCAFCNSMLGWKYDGAEDESQRYKVGKYILETKMICSSSAWEQGAVGPDQVHVQGSLTALNSQYDEAKIVFDSEDEEECEDLFAGVWNPILATKRRQARRFQQAVLTSEASQGLGSARPPVRS